MEARSAFDGVAFVDRPSEHILDYLANSFPTLLYEPFTDSDGDLCSRPVFRDGQPARSRERSPAATG